MSREDAMERFRNVRDIGYAVDVDLFGSDRKALNPRRELVRAFGSAIVMTVTFDFGKR
jgi:hypothetical protein